jgi:hypothetical protein
VKNFDKKFEKGLNAYMKLGEQAISVGDVYYKQVKTYVDNGVLGE